jgi:hypothetical protein
VPRQAVDEALAADTCVLRQVIRDEAISRPGTLRKVAAKAPGSPMPPYSPPGKLLWPPGKLWAPFRAVRPPLRPPGGHPYAQDWLLADVHLDWDRPDDEMHALFRRWPAADLHADVRASLAGDGGVLVRDDRVYLELHQPFWVDEA